VMRFPSGKEKWKDNNNLNVESHVGKLNVCQPEPFPILSDIYSLSCKTRRPDRSVNNGGPKGGAAERVVVSVREEPIRSA
jgi:hypothetical protein